MSNTKGAGLFGLAPEDFVWGTGIEDTFIPQTERAGERPLDEFALTQHYRQWREDIDLAAEIGVRAMRWGIPWYKVEPTKGDFDWEWTDQVLTHAAERGIAIIADLVHYGTPEWMDGQFLHPSYPQRVAEFAGAFAHRYESLVSHYTPQNSPSVTALLCGDVGMWPPYLEGETGYVELLRPMARGVALTVEAIRAADPGAVIVSVDGALEFLPASFDTLDETDSRTGGSRNVGDPGSDAPVEPGLLEAATIMSNRTFAGTDLVTGRVVGDHPLLDWLMRLGMPDADLDWHQDHAVDIDVIGLNYYPQFTVLTLPDADGGSAPERTWGGVAGLERAVRAFAQRYGKPVMITETDVNGTVAQRSDWLERSIAAIPRLRRAGVPLVGYTWWPLYDLIDWGYRTGTARFFDPEGSAEAPRPWSVETYVASMGLFDLEMRSDGDLARVRTPVVDGYAKAIAGAEQLLAPG